MELWIRSQDKERLRLVDSLRVYQEDEGQIDFNIQDGGCILGTYKTKERALEVLDEIQKLLMPKVIIKNIDNSVKIDNLVHIVNPTYETIEQLNTYVYEMPKD